MAIFRAETKHITRSKKHNVVAAAAYRAGEKLTDTNKFNPDAITHDYSKKQGVVATGIILPPSLIAQNFAITRQDLWSNVEQHETTTRSVKGSRLKQTARLAREWLLALPSELSDDENEQLTREFTTKLVNELGVIADYAIHKPSPFDIKPKKIAGDTELTTPAAPDSRNIHAHIMFTTRKAELNADNKLIFTDKADSERSESWRQEQKLGNGGDYLTEIREIWADMLNKRLEQKNILLVTAKSYEKLGLDIEPQRKNGKNATVMSRFNLNNEQTITTIGHNNDIKQRNAAVIKSTTDSYTSKSVECVERAISSCDKFAEFIAKQEQNTDRAQQQIRESERTINAAVECVEHAADRYSRVADFYSEAATASVRCSDTSTSRERIVAEGARNERFYKQSVAAAANCYEHNLRIVASRLAFRHIDSNKYDNRQTLELNKFYAKLDVRDFKRNHDVRESLSPALWADIVKDKLTLSHIIDNPQIVAIVINPVCEREDYAKTQQNDCKSVLNQKQYVTTADSSKQLKSVLEAHIDTVLTVNRPRF